MPKIVLPTYVAYLPSNNKKVVFRPFTVKEEKALLLALEENNLEGVSHTISATVDACTDGKVDVNTTPYYDAEYLFLQIRSKSVGELVDLIGKCDCDPSVRTSFSIDVSTAKVNGAVALNGAVAKNTFHILGTKYTIELRHPSLTDFTSVFKNPDSSGVDTLANCIVKVYSDEEEYSWSMSEKQEFLESMSPLQQKDISRFLDTMPMVELDASYTCSKCGKHHTQILSGFENFFI